MVNLATQEKLLNRITTSLTVAEGKPAIRNHSLTVETVLSWLASGKNYESLLTQHDWIEPEDIQACLLYAQQSVTQSRPALINNNLALAIPIILEEAPYIRLLVLFGSRAREDATQDSDWDFAFLCDEQQRKQYEKGGWDWLRIVGLLQKAYGIEDDKLDVIDLADCSDLLAHSIAKDGRVLHEEAPGLFQEFQDERLLSAEQLKEMRKQNKTTLMQCIQKLRNEKKMTNREIFGN